MSRKKFKLKYIAGEWVPQKIGDGGSYTHDPDGPDKPTTKDVDIQIHQGSQWVLIGTKWYKIR